jgi:hypothetical protein
VSERLTHEEEQAVLVRGDCPICKAKDGERCHKKGVPIVSGMHAGRLGPPKLTIDRTENTVETGRIRGTITLGGGKKEGP